MTSLQIASLLIVLAGLFGAVNALLLRLPSSIGILVVALATSFALLAVDLLAPGLGIADTVRALIGAIDFSDALLEGMLGLLLFAGALHVKFDRLRAQWPVVLLMATLGTALSVAVAGFGAQLLFGLPLAIALVFGAIVSPTDPVAVLGLLRGAGIDPKLETQIAGESLFNDGVGYVLFLVLMGIAFPQTAAHHGEGAIAVVMLFVREAAGGAVLGLALGWMTFAVMRRLDDYPLEVLLTLGLALGGYQLAVALGVSAPIMAVTAGLMIGAHGRDFAMSAETRGAVDGFWSLVDEILNAVLFLMIGFEVFAITLSADLLLASVGALAIALLARTAAVAVPVLTLRPFHDFTPGVVPIMIWGGLKGGISIALALSLPASEWSAQILTATYLVVLFSILVQGLTVARLARRLGAAAGQGAGQGGPDRASADGADEERGRA